MNETDTNFFRIDISLDGSAYPVNEAITIVDPVIYGDYAYMYRHDQENAVRSVTEQHNYKRDYFNFPNHEFASFPVDGYLAKHDGSSKYSILVYPHLDAQVLSDDVATVEEWGMNMRAICAYYPTIAVISDMEEDDFAVSINAGVGDSVVESPILEARSTEGRSFGLVKKTILPLDQSSQEGRYGIKIRGLFRLPSDETKFELDQMISGSVNDKYIREFPSREQMQKLFSTEVEVFRRI